MCERLILASASPRRRELLAELGVPFDVVPCPYDEPTLKSARVPAPQWAQALAYFKARAVAERNPAVWVLGADTVVACAGELLGKPRDLADARRMLELQTREVSEVVTGFCLVRHEPHRLPERRYTQHDVTRIWMRDDADLRAAYLASGDWAGKAGAYGIQNVGDRLVARCDGSFSNVVGLPVERLTPILQAVGLLAVPSSGAAAG